MGFTAMGFFFILFPEDESNIITNKKQKNNFSSLKSINTFLKPSNSTHLFPKAQFIISLCVLLIFITFLLFTISSIEPSSVPQKKTKLPPFPYALQGMGSVYRKGTRSFTELIIAHVTESVTIQELKLFIKLIHLTNVTSKSDIVLLFHTNRSSLQEAIVEESTYFLKIMHNISKFDTTHLVNSSAEPIWGCKKICPPIEDDNSTESTRLSYGSVVGFYADELDPENSLSGFMDHVPMKIRRWACYPMLLGRIRRNFKHVMLVDVKKVFLLGDDSLSRVKNLSQDSVLVTTITQFNHPTKNIDKTQFNLRKQANPDVILGGLRGIRRLSNTMLIEIVRGAMQHKKKKKNSVTELTLFNQLVGNEFLLKNVDLISS